MRARSSLNHLQFRIRHGDEKNLATTSMMRIGGVLLDI
jgi:hypothetical protein